MTAAALSNALKSLLLRGGVENPDGDAAAIIEATLGYTRAGLIVHADDPVSPEQEETAIKMARRRTAGEPLQYILGSWPFMGREYEVGEGVLIPRDDTEVVVRAALRLLMPLPSPAVVDLCAGSGIIGITLKKERPDASVAAVEKSEEAFSYLSRNAQALNADLRLIHSDLCDCADVFEDRSLDLIISNPPYIPTGEIDGLQQEVRREPRLALDGGRNGLDFYTLILNLWTKKLKKGGTIAFELGEDQFAPVKGMLEDHGYINIKGYPDIQGTIRAVTARYGENRE